MAVSLKGTAASHAVEYRADMTPFRWVDKLDNPEHSVHYIEQ
jgi:hypothetical protein